MKALEIVAIAREVIGTPYLHQQRVSGLALDCAGVPVHVARRLGMSFDDITNYGRLPQPAETRRILEANLTRIAKSAMQIGDLAWIRFGREPQHFGIVGNYLFGGLSLIHASNGSGLSRALEHRLDEQWLARIVSVWRFPGVEA